MTVFIPFNENVLACDASSAGLGAILLKDGQLLAYASCALTPTEQKYAQVEKECLAIVFDTDRFHQYTYGRKTIVHSDHKPLETIFRKSLSVQKGKNLHIADMLSCAHPNMKPNQRDCFARIHAISHLRVSE